MDDEIPNIKPKRTYLQVTEVHAEGDEVVERIPKFGVIDPELFALFLSLCQKFEQKYPEGSCSISSRDLEEAQKDHQNERDLDKILSLVDLE